MVNNAVEKVWSSYTSLPNATVDVKPLREFIVYASAAFSVCIELHKCMVISCGSGYGITHGSYFKTYSTILPCMMWFE